MAERELQVESWSGSPGFIQEKGEGVAPPCQRSKENQPATCSLPGKISRTLSNARFQWLSCTCPEWSQQSFWWNISSMLGSSRHHHHITMQLRVALLTTVPLEYQLTGHSQCAFKRIQFENYVMFNIHIYYMFDTCTHSVHEDHTCNMYNPIAPSSTPRLLTTWLE